MHWYTLGSQGITTPKSRIIKANTESTIGNLIRPSIFVITLFYFTVKRHPVELRAELHQFKPFGIISSIFRGCVARNTWPTLFGGCSSSALCSFKSHNNANTFALGHKNSTQQYGHKDWTDSSGWEEESVVTPAWWPGSVIRLKVPRENLQINNDCARAG